MVIELIIMFTEFLGIFTLFKLRNYVYNKNKFTVGPYEDILACFSFFISLLLFWLFTKERILILLALPFFVYLIVPVIIFSIKQWKEFLDLILKYIRR